MGTAVEIALVVGLAAWGVAALRLRGMPKTA